MNKLTIEIARRDIEHLKSYPSRSLREELYLQALEIALPVLEQQGGWISCSERMPEVYVAVNLWVKEDDICESSYNGYWDGEIWHQDATLTGYDNSPMVKSSVKITHWQPLPAPPQPHPSTNPQIDNDGWIEWRGGPCEISNHTDVEVKYLAGYKARGKADMFDWRIRILPKSIIAYRVIENDGRAN